MQAAGGWLLAGGPGSALAAAGKLRGAQRITTGDAEAAKHELKITETTEVTGGAGARSGGKLRADGCGGAWGGGTECARWSRATRGVGVG